MSGQNRQGTDWVKKKAHELFKCLYKRFSSANDIHRLKVREYLHILYKQK